MGNTSSIRNIWRRLTAAVVMMTLVIAPATSSYAQDGEKVGGGLGGLIGGVIGNKLGKKGNKVITTIAGVAIGAFIGSRIGKGLSKRDKEKVAVATNETLTTGRSQSWTGEKQGITGTTQLTATERRSSQSKVSVLKERVTELPPLDFINGNYLATKKENIRGGPGADYKIVGKIAKNEVVSVSGKVQEKPWYFVTQNGVGMGFVSASSVKVTTSAPIAVAALDGTVETRTTDVKRVCKTVKQTVIKDGKETTDNVTACQTADGWEVV